MSIRLEMLQVARLAPRLLGEAAENVAAFLQSQLHPAGGFKDRGGEPDLYYTVFGLEALFALRQELPAGPLEGYLRLFGDGSSLDFVHLACLARCWAMLPGKLPADHRASILDKLEICRAADGGYSPTPGQANGTVYNSFLAAGAFQDLQAEIAEPERIVACLMSLLASDGGFANQQDMPMGLTPTTAGAVTLLRHLGQPPDPSLAGWLLARHHPQGGFFATPAAPIPDLLSTATALHALSTLKADIAAIKEPCLDFIDTLWSSQGAFFGSWEDDLLDAEYTYYGLLALGHLSL